VSISRLSSPFLAALILTDIITDQIIRLSALYTQRQSLASPPSLFTRLHGQALRRGELRIVQAVFEDLAGLQKVQVPQHGTATMRRSSLSASAKTSSLHGQVFSMSSRCRQRCRNRRLRRITSEMPRSQCAKHSTWMICKTFYPGICMV
jgi:hypothetical protein